MVGSGTCLHSAGVGGVPVHHDPVLWMGYVQTPEIENGNHCAAAHDCQRKMVTHLDIMILSRSISGFEDFWTLFECQVITEVT